MQCSKNAFLLLLYMLMMFGFLSSIKAQEVTQRIRGQVFDSETRSGLPGATVIIAGTEPVKGVTTDINGFFELSGVHVGRIHLVIRFVGYDTQYVNNLLVTSGREVYLEVPMNESYTSLGEVVVTPDGDRGGVINQMAVLSARTFSMEEAQRFAGGMDDPSRLAASFAGVVPNTIDNNAYLFSSLAFTATDYRYASSFFRYDMQKADVVDQNELEHSLIMSTFMNRRLCKL